MSDTENLTYPAVLNKFKERRNESELLFPLFSQLRESFDPFKNVQSCLSIGPGPGENDLEFTKRCLPNLRKIVAVEKDRNCAEEMRANIARVYNGTLDYEVIQADITDFHPDQRFDLILIFHVVFRFTEEIRRSLIKTLLDEWIDQENGLLLVITASDDLDEKQQSINDMKKLHSHFKHLRNYVPANADDFRMDLECLDAEVVRAEKYKCDIDFRIFGDDVTHAFNLDSNVPIDSDTMKKALEEVVPSGRGTYVGEVLIIKKKNLY